MHMVASTHGIVKSQEEPHCFRFNLTWFFNALKIGDYAEGAPLFFTTLRAAYPAVAVFIVSVFMFTICVGTFMYMAERGTFQITSEYPHGAFLVNNRTASSHGQLVEGAQSNIFMSMFYVISDISTSTYV